jgi:hypothetical protein
MRAYKITNTINGKIMAKTKSRKPKRKKPAAKAGNDHVSR